MQKNYNYLSKRFFIVKINCTFAKVISTDILNNCFLKQ